MVQQAIGMIETKGLCALLEAADAALKAANVTMKVGKRSGAVCDAFFRGDVAALRLQQMPERCCSAGRSVISVHVIPRRTKVFRFREVVAIIEGLRRITESLFSAFNTARL
jgi:ethanolamine utilization protein EutM